MAPQYCEALGKTANCQSGVFICYSSPKGHALLDRRLYLPKCWFEPGVEARRKQCHIPKETNEWFLEELPKDFYYLAQIACTRKVWVKETGTDPKWGKEGCTVEQLLKAKHLLNWQTHKISEGEKGPMVAAFARLRIYLSAERTPESERWLLLRNDANGKIKYALTLPQAHLLMECSFPQPKRQPSCVLILVEYRTQRNPQACQCWSA